MGWLVLWAGKIHRLMSGRIVPTTLEKEWRFPGTGPPPTFWPFMISLGTVRARCGCVI